MRTPKDFGHIVKFRKGLFGLLAKGCWDIPEIMGSSFMALIGIGLATVGCYNYLETDGDNREYKSTYYIVRAGDPRECILKNPVFTSWK